ncbi:methyl-CpG-binding domain-containing protein 2 [Malania oleifera]|uniref:methyl-CpG-binding domain-containing protein 2 n=1 Tax=Malania oleifera TaxID=397392 RepID=UPI0025ADA036|nr:methyl-CpG-binding domain-containing protein 2 [Malania oleifera]XP_057983028.1 methyl-CpG-binding domain-containing protein 2 [Malania oleifera]XP_057983029.1 methyl-CpG-binding domain-containing protein 2 [Malania oleifera]XP_057983030.1 methyl-CpG-binding domain-containing protein 2 [Malania oleifera]XP_057983031.1 methyl-CpG-binding domain-containing protein 2 [Malania oleifera]XP_057983032.1 methyl-CpG-binding domain-containing protein 2 [Malania oleifera]XP_057983033.1 methyl-CpG-bin
MRSHPLKITFKLKKEENDVTDSTFPCHLNRKPQEPINVSSSEEENVGSQDTEDEDDQAHENVSNQLVVYDPVANGMGEIEPVPNPIDCQPPPFLKYAATNPSPRVLPSVGAFTVQCANCFKWRLIPTKEKYEEIREHILEQPFVCETAREWRPEVSCDDPPDISQDGSRLWAIDKPNIAQPPPGWQRLLRIRGEGSTKFADVYYAAPSGKRLRSMVEVQKYLLEHPEYTSQGVTLSQFSFQIPKPLQENYVRKRPARVIASCDGGNMVMPRPLEPSEVNPLAWARPDDCTDLRLGQPGFSASYCESPVGRPTKKQAKKAPSKQIYPSDLVYNQHKVKIESPCRSINDENDL